MRSCLRSWNQPWKNSLSCETALNTKKHFSISHDWLKGQPRNAILIFDLDCSAMTNLNR
jgi:hypothetical protein